MHEGNPVYICLPLSLIHGMDLIRLDEAYLRLGEASLSLDEASLGLGKASLTLISPLFRLRCLICGLYTLII